MRAQWLIIDGNNLLHSEPGLAAVARRSADLGRSALLRLLDPLAGALAERITVVFDGRSGHTGQERHGALEIIYSSSRFSADSVIERMAVLSPSTKDIVVVSSDRQERDTVEAAGVHSISCRTFWEWTQNARADVHRIIRRPAGDAARRATTLGDFFPPHSS